MDAIAGLYVLWKSYPLLLLMGWGRSSNRDATDVTRRGWTIMHRYHCMPTILSLQGIHYKGKIQKQQKTLDTEAKEMECAFEEMKMVGLLCIDAIACRPYLGRKATIIMERFNNNKQLMLQTTNATYYKG